LILAKRIQSDEDDMVDESLQLPQMKKSSIQPYKNILSREISPVIHDTNTIFENIVKIKMENIYLWRLIILLLLLLVMILLEIFFKKQRMYEIISVVSYGDLEKMVFSERETQIILFL
jgi:hypothetical protein